MTTSNPQPVEAGPHDSAIAEQVAQLKQRMATGLNLCTFVTLALFIGALYSWFHSDLMAPARAAYMGWHMGPPPIDKFLRGILVIAVPAFLLGGVFLFLYVAWMRRAQRIYMCNLGLDPQRVIAQGQRLKEQARETRELLRETMAEVGREQGLSEAEIEDMWQTQEKERLQRDADDERRLQALAKNPQALRAELARLAANAPGRQGDLPVQAPKDPFDRSFPG